SHFFFFASYSSLEYLTLAGTPTTTQSGGTSFVTTAPIATTLFLPIFTPALITALEPMTTPSSIVTPIIFLLAGYGSFVNEAAGPMKTFFPILERGGMYTIPSIIVLSPLFTLYSTCAIEPILTLS